LGDPHFFLRSMNTGVGRTFVLLVNRGLFIYQKGVLLERKHTLHE